MWGAAIGGAANAYAGLAMQQFQSRLREQERENETRRQEALLERRLRAQEESALRQRAGTPIGNPSWNVDTGTLAGLSYGDDGKSIQFRDFADMPDSMRQGLLAQRQAEQAKAQQELSNLSALEQQRLAAATNSRANAGAAARRGDYYDARTETERMTQEGTLPERPSSRGSGNDGVLKVPTPTERKSILDQAKQMVEAMNLPVAEEKEAIDKAASEISIQTGRAPVNNSRSNPVVVTSAAEVARLSDGTWVKLPNGTVRQK